MTARASWSSDVGRIVRVDVARLDPPLPRPWGPEVTRLHFVVVTVVTDCGATGTGFTWTPSVGAGAIHALLVDDIAPLVCKRPADPSVWPAVHTHLRDLGRGGVATLALAGLDTAIWDLAGRAIDQPVSAMIGTPRTQCDAYFSGINWHYTLDELAAQAATWVDRDAHAVKIKVGAPRTLDDDRRRVEVVRRIIGADRRLMLDANQRWSRAQAVESIRALADFDLTWVEEPIASDDIDGLSEVAASVPVPVAAGENAHTAGEFDELLRRVEGLIVQPNLARVGGITPFLGIVERIQVFGNRIVPHLLPEVSAPLIASLTPDGLVEIPDGALLDELGVLGAPSPISVVGGLVHMCPRPGLGLDFALNGTDSRLPPTSRPPSGRPPSQERS